MAARQRLTPEVRRRQIVEAAAGLLLERGHLPLPMEGLAAAAGVSKGLVYGYFPTQWDLFNAVLLEELDVLRSSGFDQAAEAPELSARARGCADLYLQHVAARGPLVHYILRDSFMAGRIAPDAARLRDRLLRGFARLLRRELRLPATEAVAVVFMVAAIPEEMGRLAWQGELQLDRAREMTARLVDSSLAALRPR
ncbi:TetR/AcrR family transcriptional regulator [Phenylobacterium sp. J426]|uniref:TetR/AcrR family transcriptional regulator n=1 Tax=Phenylobacterium sp. J426 TaxID=2898439 RepID=UPI0021512D0A|nr:TetR/AcrR family transcriptional regulator [Phenylobacterium sp. J426]MCR5872812.1 TetR/AcrR family transcriptional regulator [Phenylobacterium sp. J426]